MEKSPEDIKKLANTMMNQAFLVGDEIAKGNFTATNEAMAKLLDLNKTLVQLNDLIQEEE
jgi:hypothetical protein